MGTGAYFQGFPVCGMEFNRARGVGATPSWVEILTPSLETFVVTPPPEGGSLPGPNGEGALALAAARGITAGTAGTAPLLNQLAWAGWLGICEVGPSGTAFGPYEFGPFVVVSVQSVKRSGDGKLHRARVVLADPRFLWDRGLAPRWSYNRLRPDGTPSLDSHRPGTGEPWTRAAVLADVVSGLHGRPTLGRVPDDFATSQGGVDFEPGSAALEALNELCLKWGLTEPCLDLDGRVSFWRLGEGRLGYAPAGRGENAEDLPPEVWLHKGGAGVGHKVELGHPPEYVLVFGGPRVATVAIDNWEPVLHVRNRFLPLTEATVRALTKGRRGLDWLRVAVLSGQARYFQQAGLPPEVGEILGRAWRLWRLPGVNREDQEAARLAAVQAALQVGAGFGSLVGLGALAGPAGVVGAAGVAASGLNLPADVPPGTVFDAEAGRFVGKDGSDPAAQARLLMAQLADDAAAAGVPRSGLGPNAHLLPLQDRAETADGRRLPVTVETYSFGEESFEWSWSEEAVQYSALTEKLAELRRQLEAEAAGAAKPSPFGSRTEYQLGGLGRIRFTSAETAWATRRALSTAQIPESVQPPEGAEIVRGISPGEFWAAVDLARSLRRAADVNGQVAGEYEKLVRERYVLAGREDLGTVLDMGKAYLDAEDRLNALGVDERAFSGLFSDGSRFKVVLTLEAELADKAEDLRRQLETKAQEVIANGGNKLRTPRAARYWRNRGRQVDEGARVYDAEAGVILTSRLPGWLAREGVAQPNAAGGFVPKPVRVIFGATVRPRADVPRSPGPRRPVTQRGTPEAEGGEGDVIPPCLGDREGYFVRLFKRGGAQPELVKIDGLSEEQERALTERALVLREPRLVELLPIVGAGNADQLTLLAAERAKDAMNRVPLVLREQRVTLGRPWPVNCDGVVSGVQIRLRPNCAGFETLVETGRRSEAVGALRTMVRQRTPGAQPDAARREGLTAR